MLCKSYIKEEDNFCHQATWKLIPKEKGAVIIMRQKKGFLLLFIFVLTLMSLTACGRKGKLDEGDCRCNIFFTDIPKEFYMLEQNLLNEFEIYITLENTINENQYDITLNQKNNYSTQISLHPGVYRVSYVSNSMSRYNGILLTARTDTVELTADTVGEIAIVVDNPDEFTKNWMATQPMPEMLLADKFSRQLQINRKVISMENIMQELDLTPEINSPVSPYQKATLANDDYGITVTVLNNTDESLSWQECDVIGIHVTKNTMVFPEGVTLGMASGQVLDKTKGLYGEPDACTGSLLFGWQLDDTSFIYNDAASGDRLTVNLSPDGSYIKAITYEFACFE